MNILQKINDKARHSQKVTIETSSPSRSKEHKEMVSLIKLFNDTVQKEHWLHMNGYTAKHKANQKKLNDKIAFITKEFKKKFRKYIPKEDVKEFSLSVYDTSDPELFATEWLKSEE